MILRASLSQEISLFDKRLLAYAASMSYTYCQLCVTADASSMLPITIEMEGETKHIDEYCQVIVHEKEIDGDMITIDVFPKKPFYIMPLMKGIMSFHPEFKTTVETYEDDQTHAIDEAREKERQEHPENFDPDADEELELSRQYIRCVMPPVDKDRRDTLLEFVKLYRDKCQGDFDECKAKTLANMAPNLIGISKAEVDKAKEKVDQVYDYYNDMADKLTDDKKKQIEEAYQEYIKEHPEGANSTHPTSGHLFDDKSQSPKPPEQTSKADNSSLERTTTIKL